MKHRMVAVSRRSANPPPSHAFSSAFSSASVSTAGGASSTEGPRIRAMGFVVTSPSSSGHLKSCCSERKRTATVVVLNRVWRPTMKFSTALGESSRRRSAYPDARGSRQTAPRPRGRTGSSAMSDSPPSRSAARTARGLGCQGRRGTDDFAHARHLRCAGGVRQPTPALPLVARPEGFEPPTF